MPNVGLPSVDEALSKAKAAIAANKKCVAFVGPAGCGKTSALDQLAAEYPGAIRLRIPRDDDGAIAAITSLAEQLSPKAEDIVRDSKVTYIARLDKLLQCVPKDAALFFDEPMLSSPWEAWDEPIFAVRAREFSLKVMAMKEPLRVMTSSAPEDTWTFLDSANIAIQRKANPKEILDKAGLAGPSIDQLVEKYGAVLQARSPIEIRLAGHAAIKSAAKALEASEFRLRNLVKLASKQMTSGVKQILARLALVREPDISTWLDWAAEGTKPEDRRVVETIFLFGSGSALRLHESLTWLARTEHWLTRPKRDAAHRQIAERYSQHFTGAAQAVNLQGALRAECEVVHHKTQAGDPTLLQDTLLFAEQYDVLGRTFGTRGERLYKERRREKSRESIQFAVKAYERALENDPSDWYAAHYLAFNLDVLGKDLVRIEKAYLDGIELRPSFAWGHSRWARFLINCGRYGEARSALDAAIEQFSGEGQQPGPLLYAELHLDVARQFLQFGEYKAAAEVLKKVPEHVRAKLDRYEPLARYAEWQREPDENELVFPAALPLSKRNAPVFQKPGEKVVEFMPGRLATIAAGEHRFRVKLKSEFGWRNCSGAELKALGLGAYLPLHPGTFVEFLKVKKDGKMVERAAIHPEVNPFEDLEVRYPPPDRFLET